MLAELVAEAGELLAARETIKELRSEARSAVRRQRLEQELEPYQVELLKLQRHLEETNRRMIVVFEGRDAAGNDLDGLDDYSRTLVDRVCQTQEAAVITSAIALVALAAVLWGLRHQLREKENREH